MERIDKRAGDFLLFWADDDVEQGPNHTNFKLSNDGESIGLFNSSAKNFDPIDMVSFGQQTGDISFGRFPDGSDDWALMIMATPGASNYVYICGDVNRDNSVNIGDIVTLVAHVFNSVPLQVPIEAGDVNCDGLCNVGDVVYITNFVFRSLTSPYPCENCP